MKKSSETRDRLTHQERKNPTSNLNDALKQSETGNATFSTKQLGIFIVVVVLLGIIEWIYM